MDRWGVFDSDVWATIRASLAKNSTDKYRSIFKRFEDYLDQIGKSVETVNLRQILDFLQDFVGRPASTIRSVHAALFYYFRLFRCEKVLDNPLIRMHYQGAQRLAPPPVKKLVIWDPEIPLRHIAAKPRPKNFLAAAKEALLLLLLSTGIRVDCASKMSFEISLSEENCVIPYLLARKTGVSEPQSLRTFEENERLCPVRAISRFLALSKRIREPDEKFLFISSRGTRAHIDTLRHWVIDLLSESGVEKTTAGSCRSAVSSAAFLREFPIDLILRAAGWKRESTFRRYYQRQICKVPPGVNLLPSMNP